MIRNAAVAVVASLLAACMTAIPEPKPEGEFAGLKAFLGPGPGGRAFFVHGMCDHSYAEWVTKRAAGLGRLLGADASPPTLYTTASGGTLVNGEFPKVEVFSKVFVRDGASLTAYFILWAGTTRPLKARLDVDATEPILRKHLEDLGLPPPAGKEFFPAHLPRAKVNASLKTVLLNRCLADAVIYSGPYGENVVRPLMQLALCQVIRQRPNDPKACDAPAGITPSNAGISAAVVTESLGSKVLFDALSGNRPAVLKDPQAALGTIRQIFMLANQLPLLDLADDETALGRPAGDPGLGLDAAPAAAPARGMQTFLRGLGPERGAPGLSTVDPGGGRRTIAVLSDPNDLLTYRLPKDYGGWQVINVPLSNAPTILGLFEDPYQAHTGFYDNPAAMDVLVCGSAGAKGC